MDTGSEFRVERQLEREAEDGDGFALFDRDLRFREVNRALATLSGRPVEEHLGRTVGEVLPELAPTMAPLLTQVFATAEPVIDVEIHGAPTARGSSRLLASYYPVRSRGGTVTAVDAIVRVLPAAPWPHRTSPSLAALRERERFAASLIEASPNLIYVYDLVSNTNRYINRRFEHWLGHTADDLDRLGSAWLHELIHPEDLPVVGRHLEQLRSAADGEVREVDYRFRHRDGSWRWLRSYEVVFARDAAGFVTQVLGVAEDVTARLAAAAEPVGQRGPLRAAGMMGEHEGEEQDGEQALRRANERLSLALDRLDGFLYEYDARTGRTERSDGFARVLGYDPALVPANDRWWVEQVHPDDLPLMLDTGMTALQSDAPSYSLEYRVRHQNGRYLTLWDRGLIERDATGQVLRVLGTTINITERKQADAERVELLQREREARQEVEAALERAEAATRERDLLISIAAHDLRTPLTVILGQSQLLHRRALRAGLDERSTRSVAAIAEQAERLNQMIGALLDLSRIQEGRLTIVPEPLDLVALLRRLVAEVQASLTVHELLLYTPDGPLLLLADPLRLEQVFHNLLANAVKYSPDGGTITVRVGADERHALVAVSDQGIGIPSEALPNLFTRFYRAPNATAQTTSSLGIGLFVVRELIQAHGGSVTVASALGVGSTFTVALPRPSTADSGSQQG